MSDLHEVVFKWPYNANEAIVTGTFDQWARSVRMNKGPSGFTATVRVPWGDKVLYKFIVDGRWSTIDGAPTEADWKGNLNNVYFSPTKPKELDTPRNEPPAAQEPKIAPVPAPVPVEKKEKVPAPAPKPTEKGNVGVPAKPEQPIENETPVVKKKEPSPPVEEKIIPPAPKVDPVPVVPVNDTKSVHTPPAKTEKVATPEKAPAILPTPATLKSPLVIVPVNDASTAVKKPPTFEPPKHTDTPSTHSLPINNPRKASTGTSSSNTLLAEKKGEERREPRPEEVKQPNGITNGITNGIVKAEEPAQQQPATPVKDKTPTLPAAPATPPKFTSLPATPKNSHFPGSASSSPPSSPGNTISRKSSFKKKRDSFISKIKHLFTPEKKKEHKRANSHG